MADTGYTKEKTSKSKPKHVVTELARARPNRRLVITAFVTGMFLFGIGLPLFIGGQGPAGEENLGMIIPGAIMFGIGGFLLVGASLSLISSWAESMQKPASPLQGGPGGDRARRVTFDSRRTMLIIGAISAESLHHEESSTARLWITDVDGMGDQGFMIFIEGTPGDFNSNGIHDYCERVVVNAHHSGSWMSEPWTGTAKWNDADHHEASIRT